MQRHALGIISVVLLLAGAAIHFGEPADNLQGISGMCIKVGVVLFALWLAFPKLHRLPTWMYRSIIISVIVVARWPRMIFLVVPLALIYWMLQPRKKTKSTPSVSKSSTNTKKSS